MSLPRCEREMIRRTIIVVMLLAAGGAYLAGLRYCASTHGLGYYGVNRGNAPTPVPNLLRAVYDPALFAVARYYRWRGNPSSCCGTPLDIQILDRFLFTRAWSTPESNRQPRIQRDTEARAR